MPERESRKTNIQALSKPAFFVLLLLIIIFSIPPTYALALGLIIGIVFTNPYPKETRRITKYLLQASIVGLGFGMNFQKVIEAGKDGFVFTLLTIAIAMGIGFMLGKILNVNRIISYLISVGTAICGGSAIAAVSQVINADEKEVSVSIGTVFILNGIALFIFPVIGAYAGLTAEQFGIWCAIAIHDTSSVVGAASHFSNEALMTATTVKLARALWIIPFAIITSVVFKRNSSASAFPWFILFFIAASITSSWLTIPLNVTDEILKLARTGFSVTLFLIGAGISVEALRSVGVRPFLQGLILWIIILLLSLFFVTR